MSSCRQLRRADVLSYLADEPCMAGMEARGSWDYWNRGITKLGPVSPLLRGWPIRPLSRVGRCARASYPVSLAVLLNVRAVLPAKRRSIVDNEKVTAGVRRSTRRVTTAGGAAAGRQQSNVQIFKAFSPG